MFIPIEKIWKHYGNKYKAINIGTVYARKLKDAQSQGLVDKNLNTIKEALKILAEGRVKAKE